ncbi:ABC transporter ATP-binding protein [Roseicyclus sp. F158]|uniref:ABC transporter ATP-binding protein n=1 Tax=Tropicimonas omnivorans TaxID=3075590 RepID=A0ABU3DL56_9RHOB|nr:ABC transporter ATP-binding protein [Roseicyclus sp. F158]MDT0684328.1 ABC transporter ATP-binding protein [Roseicyclus sp. F158]
MSAPVLALDDVSIRYPGAPAAAVRNVSFEIGTGETLGIVGESGSGKSTLAAAMMGLLPSGSTVTGGLRFEGRDLFGQMTERELRQLRGRDIATIAQDPFTALNPVMKIGRQLDIFQHWYHDRPRAERKARILKMLEQVRLSDPGVRMQQYPHQLSGGILQRVSIAAALLAEPKLLIADEPTTALDATTEAQILGIMAEAKETLRGATVFITHDMSVVERLCDRIAVLYAGELVETGTVAEVLKDPRHPYTKALLECDPARIEEPTSELPTIGGTVPALDDRPAGCIFEPRCPSAVAHCRAEAPKRHDLGPRQSAACHLVTP